MATPDGNCSPTTRTNRLLALSPKLLVGALVVLAFTGGSGVAVAQEEVNPGNPGKSCPGENENVGFEQASEQGKTQSMNGIVRAAQVIGCPLPID